MSTRQSILAAAIPAGSVIGAVLKQVGILAASAILAGSMIGGALTIATATHLVGGNAGVGSGERPMAYRAIHGGAAPTLPPTIVQHPTAQNVK